MAIIKTTHGDLDESVLEKREGVVDNENEHTTWVEYWLKHGTVGEPELVHRSAAVRLKKPVTAGAVAASFR